MENQIKEATIFKQGHSLCISIPYRLVEKLKLKVGSKIEAKIKKAK